jgi:hypothetical protein
MLGSDLLEPQMRLPTERWMQSFRSSQISVSPPKDFILESLKDAPGGSHIVLKTKHPDGDNDLVAVGYRYNSMVTLFFECRINRKRNTI